MDRIAKALGQLRDEVNTRFPSRSKRSDGWIGDSKHASRNSDHNPWIIDGRDRVVSALDLTHDPANGFDSYAFAEWLRAKRDPRVKYIISNRKILSRESSPWKWRPYSGINPHNHHIHISVEDEKARYDDTVPWGVPDSLVTVKGVVHLQGVSAVTRRGKSGKDVQALQRRLTIKGIAVKIDGEFGQATEIAVEKFQKAHGIVADGIVGPHTWALLLADEKE